MDLKVNIWTLRAKNWIKMKHIKLLQIT